GADSRQATGWYERGFPDDPFDVALRYRTLRIWQVPPERWLAGGLGLVPLAPLGDVRQKDLPATISQMKRRLDEAPRNQAAELWSAANILMGLRYERALVQKLLQGVVTMKESVTYQAILEEGQIEGKIKEARRIVLLLGRDQFGEPSADVQAALDAITDVNRLEELTIRSKHVSSWQELLGLNGPGRRGRGRKKTT